MPRIAKITSNKSDEAYQRDRTDNLKRANEQLGLLPLNAPAHLQSHAKWLWEVVAPELNNTGYVTSIDSTTFEALCINYQVLREAYESINTVGSVYIKEDKLNKNPAVALASDATAKIKSLATSLGLSPASRATLVDMSVNDDDDSSVDDLLNKFGGGN